ncbi:hypothetical protein LV779_36735 [Streptomyces thinghirensis]|nr:hypothetical protein [Streptomyces thinghirensis]
MISPHAVPGEPAHALRHLTRGPRARRAVPDPHRPSVCPGRPTWTSPTSALALFGPP